MNISIVGSTGVVGKELIELLTKRNFKFNKCFLYSSARSAGKVKFEINNKIYDTYELNEKSFDNVDITFFCSSNEITKKYAPIALEKGNIIIDNSSYYRMDPNVPLVVPEINKDIINTNKSKIIANPNCSSIILNMLLFPLQKLSKIDKVIVNTYQAISGAGADALNQLENQTEEWTNDGCVKTMKPINKQLLFNVFSHNSTIDLKNKYNGEELKIINETKKILNNMEIKINPTCIRVPVLRTHMESVTVYFKNIVEKNDIYKELNNFEGVTIIENDHENEYPEPIKCSNQDDIFVGRIRKNVEEPEGYCYNFLLCGDQLLKGAALNAIQIAESIA